MHNNMGIMDNTVQRSGQVTWERDKSRGLSPRALEPHTGGLVSLQTGGGLLKEIETNQREEVNQENVGL